MTEYALVPVEDINRLEQARKELHVFLQERRISGVAVLHITERMWHITHRKYKLIEGEDNGND